MTDVGFGLNPVIDNVRPSAYVQQWMTGAQYSLTNNDLIDISYVGNHGVHVLSQYLEWDEIPASDLSLGNQLLNQVTNPFFGHITSSGCGLDQPTVPMGQLLRRFPEYCSVTEAPPAVGGSTYNALQATYTHRWHSGLDVNVSYTYSKFMDDVQGAAGWAFPGSGSSVRNSYNLAAEHSVDVTDTPHSLVVNYNYELPFGAGKMLGSGWNRPVNAVLGGWQWSGILTAKSGLPLSINPATNNTGGFGFNQRPDLVAGVNPVPAESVNHRLDQSSGVCAACGIHIWRCSAISVESESAQILQLRHGHRKMVGLRRGEKTAVPRRNVQCVQSSEFLRARHQSGRQQFRNNHFGLSRKEHPVRGKILLVAR